MLPGTYEPGPVIEARLRIYVNGEERAHTSASWQGNTTGGLPESLVAAGDGVYSRTGSITWAPGSAVTMHPLAPVGETRWTPQHGDTVYIEAEVNGERFPRFTGYLGASTYDLLGDKVTTAITDGLGEALQTVLSVEPGRGGRLRSSWVAYRALEQAGLGILPPVTGDTVLHNSYQGGIRAAVGKETNYGIGYSENNIAAVTDAVTQAADTPRQGRDVMVYSRAGSPEDPGKVRVALSDGTAVALLYTPDTQKLSLSISTKGPVWSQTVHPASEHQLLAFKMNHIGTRIWLSPDESVLVTGVTIPADVTVTEATGTRIAGVKVDYLTDWEDGGRRVAAMPKKLPAIKLSSLETERLPAVRGFENVTAEKIISEWCASTLSTVWVDEEGVLNAAARDRLAAGAPGIIDEVEERVFSGSWRTARDGIRSAVIVKTQAPSIAGHGSWGSAKVYQPENIIELEPHKTHKIFYTLPEEVDVVGLDTNFRPLVLSKKNIYDWDDFDKSTGSWWAICFESPGEVEGFRWTGSHPDHETLTGSLEKLGQRTIKMSFRVDRNSPSSIEKYYLVTPTMGVGALRYGNRGMPMPLVRADNVITWFPETIRVPSQASLGGNFELDAAWWLQPADAHRVAQALAAEIGIERVTFDQLEMLWDPRKQIGDSHILRASDENGQRWEVKYLLTGYKEAWEGHAPSCSYDLAAKELTDLRANKTYADMAAAYTKYADIPASKTYGQVYAALPERSQ